MDKTAYLFAYLFSKDEIQLIEQVLRHACCLDKEDQETIDLIVKILKTDLSRG